MRPSITLVFGVLLALPFDALAQTPTFEKDVLPILTTNCLSCHGGLHQRAGLDLRTVPAMLKGGKTGEAVAAGSLEKSLLWKKIESDEMPRSTAKLSAAEKETISEWIKAKLPLAPSGTKEKLDAGKREPRVVAAEIDGLIERQLSAAKVKPAQLADDAEFLRRVSLDLTGRLPSVARTRAFFDAKDPDKRAKLIDELLNQPEFGRHWGTHWHHWIVPPNDAGKRTFDAGLMDWLAIRLNTDAGWDATVRELLTATGSPATVPEVGFMIANPDANKAADKARRVFLGLNMECAECHNHPFTQWRQQEDFWGMAAFFSAVKIKIKNVVTEAGAAKAEGKGPAVRGGGASIKIPTSALRNVGTVVKASLLGDAPELKQAPYRPVLADWIVSPKNPYFARAAVNRYWWHLFGRGFVMPLDDFHDGNPASHPELLDRLAQEFRVSGHNVKHLMRCVCNSKAYQRSSQTEDARDAEEALFGRMRVRMLPPEVLYDAFTQTLGIKDLNLGVPISKKGEKSTPPRHLFINAFDHKEDLPDATTYYHDILQILQLANATDLNRGGETAQRLAASTDVDAGVEEMFLMTYCRRPSAAERERFRQFVTRNPDRSRGFAMALWAVLNSSEFAFNH